MTNQNIMIHFTTEQGFAMRSTGHFLRGAETAKMPRQQNSVQAVDSISSVTTSDNGSLQSLLLRVSK
jgi:hypothetical protein